MTSDPRSAAPDTPPDALPAPTPLTELVARARRLARPGERAVLGIVGAPGSGKSTLAAAIVEALGPDLAVSVPMDGYHLANSVLRTHGWADVKGAIHTFDDAGYAALLDRLAHQRPDEVVYAPFFDRSIEEALAGSIAVRPDVPLVVTEGNYLLMDSGAWPRARARLAECWYVDADPAQRLEWLVARHVVFGKTPEAARAWASTTDEANARQIAATAHLADLRIRPEVTPAPGQG